MKIIDAQFIAGYATPDKLPRYEGGEIGVVGRSNVGKSSLLNRLTNRKKLARVSNTPGRTLQINIFEIVYQKPPSQKHSKINLVDLPGFGFAKVDKQTSLQIFDLVTAYLSSNHPKKALLLLVDSRREPADEELDCFEACKDIEMPVIIVMTKADKLSKSEIIKRKAEIAKVFGIKGDEIIESGEGMSVIPIWNEILARI